MSEKITKNQLQEQARREGVTIYYCMNCALQHFTYFCDEIGHNEGLYGCNWTAWELPDGDILVSGPRVPSTIGVYIDYTLCRVLDSMQQEKMYRQYNFYTAQKEFNRCYKSTYKPMIELYAEVTK